MKKRVYKLKKKHRNSIWRDDEGDFWYWDSITEAWAVLRVNDEGYGFSLNDDYTPDCCLWWVAVAKTRTGF